MSNLLDMDFVYLLAALPFRSDFAAVQR